MASASYGIGFYIPDLSRNRYFDFMIGGAEELGTDAGAFFALARVGRCLPLIACFLVSGGMCVATVAVNTFLHCAFFSQYFCMHLFFYIEFLRLFNFGNFLCEYMIFYSAIISWQFVIHIVIYLFLAAAWKKGYLVTGLTPTGKALVVGRFGFSFSTFPSCSRR